MHALHDSLASGEVAVQGVHPPTSGVAAPRGRLEVVVGLLGLVAALAVLPLPTIKGTPEMASVLAISAIALLAGHRWALGLVVLADIALVGALWPRAFLLDPPSVAAQVGVALGLAGALPGLLLIGRAAPAVAEVVLGRATRRAQSASLALIVIGSALWLSSPLL